MKANAARSVVPAPTPEPKPVQYPVAAAAQCIQHASTLANDVEQKTSYARRVGCEILMAVSTSWALDPSKARTKTAVSMEEIVAEERTVVMDGLALLFGVLEELSTLVDTHRQFTWADPITEQIGVECNALRAAGILPASEAAA